MPPDDSSIHLTFMESFSWLQWPAMAVTIVAAWLVASESATRRNVGFWVFLVSNVLWVVWGFIASAYALIVLQIALAAMNIRGACKSEKTAEQEEKSLPAGGTADRPSSVS